VDSTSHDDRRAPVFCGLHTPQPDVINQGLPDDLAASIQPHTPVKTKDAKKETKKKPSKTLKEKKLAKQEKKNSK
jgi:hypothetical protein